jgi:DNA-binding transcriptional LysR family regulator
VLREQELLQQALRGSAEQPQGRLVLGVVPTALPIAARFAAQLAARHPGLRPELRSLSSQEIETGLDTLAIDLGLGYTERPAPPLRARLQVWPQYVERYHLLQRSAGGAGLQFGPPATWAEAAALPLALLSPDMHNRVLLDAVFAQQGLQVQPAFETNSVFALLLAVQQGTLAAVLPGALVATLAGPAPLLARPLGSPELHTPIGFMGSAAARPSRALQAALRLAADATWLADVAAHSGQLGAASSPR